MYYNVLQRTAIINLKVLQCVSCIKMYYNALQGITLCCNVYNVLQSITMYKTVLLSIAMYDCVVVLRKPKMYYNVWHIYKP